MGVEVAMGRRVGQGPKVAVGFGMGVTVNVGWDVGIGIVPRGVDPWHALKLKNSMTTTLNRKNVCFLILAPPPACIVRQETLCFLFCGFPEQDGLDVLYFFE